MSIRWWKEAFSLFVVLGATVVVLLYVIGFWQPTRDEAWSVLAFGGLAFLVYRLDVANSRFAQLKVQLQTLDDRLKRIEKMTEDVWLADNKVHRYYTTGNPASSE